MNIANSEIIGDNTPSIAHAEPVLAVGDILATVAYWKEVLGFPKGWTYGNPPNHGGVSWDGAGFIQFGLNPELATRSSGHSVWVRAKNIQALHHLHKTNKAEFASPLKSKPWGFLEYTVIDLNGYLIHFSEPALDGGFKSIEMPDAIRIVPRIPSQDELRQLVVAVGWGTGERDPLLHRCVTGMTAINTVTGQAAGCVLLFGDGVGFYYIKNLIVDPKWQGKRIATGLMKSLMKWLTSNAADGATVGLFTGDHLANFYRQFGFMQCCGMYQQILHK
ncbi:MAG: GNAT family N-acetyltransferase [Chryseolinea sp.]